MKEPGLGGWFSIRDIATMLDGKDMVQELHRHDFYYVLALEKGSGFHAIDFTDYDVCNHSVFFMRPGHVHSITLNAGSSGFLMQFKKGFYDSGDMHCEQLLRRAGNKNLCQLNAEKFKRLNNILGELHREYNEQQEHYQQVVKAHLTLFFTELIRFRQGRQTVQPVKPFVQEQLDIFMTLLETHFSEHKQVSDYAGMMNLSVYQLNAVTKAAMGKTSSEMINDYLILEARRYLLATSAQITRIAYHLGYDDVSYFIRFFKKHTGYSPEAFRKHFK